jgi:hypothetical protein
MTAARLTADPPALARRLADYTVLSNSPDVPLAAADYWALSVEHYRSVHEYVRGLLPGRPRLGARYQALVGDTADPVAYRALVSEAAQLLGQRPDLAGPAAGLVAAADAEIWIDHSLGASYTGRAPEYGLARLAARPVPPGAGRPESGAGSARPRIDIVIPFRDAERGRRARNLLACLHALRDQDCPAAHYRVTVVESDRVPRNRDLIEPLADRYVFADKDGLFNKSWTVNVGLRGAADPATGRAPELTCILDADILVERSFVSTNAARLDNGEHDAHLPHRRMISLDGPSSDQAIRERLEDGAPTANTERLRALVLRETPGGILWARTGVLHRIGGFDERFEGWGGEDDDVTARLARRATFTRFDDPLLHLSHPRPQMVREDGRLLNEHLAGQHAGPDAWTGASGYGQPARLPPAAAAGSRA